MREKCLTIWAVLGLVGVAVGQTQNEGDIESLIASFFNVTTTSAPGGPEPDTGPTYPTFVQPVSPDNGPTYPTLISEPLTNLNKEPERTNGPDQPGPGGAGVGAGPDEDCECVPYYLCANGSVVDNGFGIIDIRFRECDSYLDVCCKTPNPPTEPITPAPKGHRGCGKRNVDGVGFRITGGVDNEAQFGEIPWMVAILREEILDDGTKLHVYQCGGALIHRQVVMTGAHCVAGRNVAVLRARAGEWDTQTRNELLQFQDRAVSQIVIHEKYYGGALYNDIALLIVSEPFEYADNVDVVCLPKQGDVILDKDCFASGWGKDKYGKEGNYQVILKKVDVPMVPRDKCIEALRRTRLGSYFRLHESFVCAGGEQGKDTCKGDGGGPLVCPIPGRSYEYQQVGMVAWGIGCGQEEVPAVYVNVAHFRNWIDQHMAKFGFQIEYNY